MDILWWIGLYTWNDSIWILKGKKSAHFIWHFFVLAGVAIQFIGVYMYVYL